MRLTKPGLGEVQVHEDELASGSGVLHDEFQGALHGLTGPGQVFDELALAVHVDVDRVCLRVDAIAVMPVLLVDGRRDDPLEVVFTEARERQGHDHGFRRGTQDREVRNRFQLVHLRIPLKLLP